MSNTANLLSLEKAKIPPQAIDLEEVVLGACLFDSKGVDEMVAIIKTADVFYVEKHGYIFTAIKSLYSSNDPIDLLTVSERLKLQGRLDEVGGDFYLF